MSLSIHLTTSWTPDQIAPYGRDITACLRRLVEAFPNDATMTSAWADIVSGRLQLWIIRDDETDRVVMIQCTEIITNAATGHRFVRLLFTGGGQFHDALPLIDEIEAWARDVVGATEIESVGRRAFERLLAGRGYRQTSVTMTKLLETDDGR